MEGGTIDPEKPYKIAAWASINRAPEGRLMWDIVHDYIRVWPAKLTLSYQKRPRSSEFFPPIFQD
jgi:hypothetical protein